MRINRRQALAGAGASLVAAAVRAQIITAGGSIVSAGGGILSIAGGGSGGALPALTLTSAVTNASAPWTFGHAFKQGDVPSGQYITASSGTSAFQADIRNRWPDGSAKYALLSGISSLVANTPATVQLAVTSTAPSGSNVSEPTNLANTNIALTAGTGSYPVSGTLAINSVLGVDRSTWSFGNGGRIRQILGPVMSEFHYYQPLSGTQVAIWWYVRAYSNGAVEVEIVVENGYWQETSPAPSEADYSITVNINGISTFTQSNIAHYSHSRWSRVDWYSGGNPITPAHNVPYLLSTRMVPNFGWGPTSGSPTFNTTLGGFRQTTVNPTTVFSSSGYYGDLSTTSISSGGQSPWIGPLTQWEALYCTTADPRMYAATVGNARQWGGFAQHFRDETTGRVPLWSSYPSKSVYSGPYTLPPTAAGTRAPAYGDGPVCDSTHLPACGYLAYLIEGRWSFLEEMQFTAWASLQEEAANVSGWTGIVYPTAITTTRGIAWQIREMAHVTAVGPTSLAGVAPPAPDTAVRTSFVTSLSNSITNYKQVFIDGTTLFQGYSWANGIGMLGHYDGYSNISGPFWGASWMAAFQSMALSIVADLGIEGIGNQADVISVRNFSYLDTLNKLQAQGVNTWNAATNYRRALAYVWPYTSNNNGSGGIPSNPTFYASGAAFTEYLSTANPENSSGLNASLSSSPGQSLKAHESDTDVAAGSSTGSGGDSSSLGGQNYGAMHLTVAELAAEAAIPGAAAALALITGSTTYLGTSSSGSTTTPPLSGAADSPQFNFVSRSAASDNSPAIITTPSWYTSIPRGTWAQIPNSVLNGSAAQIYGAFTDASYAGHTWSGSTSGNPIVPWSGGILNTTGIYDHASSTFIQGTFLCCWGGGHTDYYGNEMYCFGPLESTSPQWYCPRAATDPPVIVTSSSGPWFDANGNPVARHTYNSLTYLPNRNWMFASWTYAESSQALYPNAQSLAFQFNQQTPGSVQPWKPLANAPGAYAEPVSAYDPVWNIVWATDSGASNSDVFQYNPLTNSWSSASAPTSGNWNDHATSCIDTKRGIWAIWDSGNLCFYEVYSGAPSSNGFYVPTLSGSLPSISGYAGSILYDSINDYFVIWPGSGKSIYKLVPPSSLPYKGGNAWTVTAIAPSSGATPDAEYSSTGTFGKFQFVPNPLVTGYVLVSLANGYVYFYRP